MGCLLLAFSVFFPRIVLVVLYLSGDYIGRAYQTTIWPLLGFFLFPCTTLAYAYAKNTHGAVEGGYLWLVIIAVLIDLGSGGDGANWGRRRISARAQPDATGFR